MPITTGLFLVLLVEWSSTGNNNKLVTFKAEATIQSVGMKKTSRFSVLNVICIDKVSNISLECPYNTYGHGTVQELEQRARTIVKLNRVDYEEAIELYRQKIRELD